MEWLVVVMEKQGGDLMKDWQRIYKIGSFFMEWLVGSGGRCGKAGGHRSLWKG